MAKQGIKDIVRTLSENVSTLLGDCWDTNSLLVVKIVFYFWGCFFCFLYVCQRCCSLVVFWMTGKAVRTPSGRRCLTEQGLSCRDKRREGPEEGVQTGGKNSA